MYSNQNIHLEERNTQSSVYLSNQINSQQYLDSQGQRIQPLSLLFFKRGRTFSVHPIESEGDNDSDHQTKIYLGCQSSITIHMPLLRKAIRKEPLIKSAKKSGRANKIIVKSNKNNGSNIQKSSISWDHYDIKDLSEEIVKINRQSKSRNYEQIKAFFIDKINGKTKKHVIVISGEKSTGKKSILFDLLCNSELGVGLEHCFMSFEDEINSNFDDKIKKFYDFLKQQTPKRGKVQRFENIEQLENKHFQQVQYDNRIDNHPSIKQMHTKIQQQTPANAKRQLKKIVIINNYQTFIEGIREKLLYNKFRNLVEQNIDILFVFIGNPTSFIDKKMLEDLKTEFFTFGKNTKQYMLNSFLAYFQQYPFKYCKWIFQRPLANFLCSKLEEKSLLKLSLIKKFIKFVQIEVKEANSQIIQRKVTRQIIDKFLQTLGIVRVKIDLQKLPFHEKVFLLAIYLFLEQNPQLRIQYQQIKKQYKWICSSFSVSPKTDNQLSNESLYQLETYQLIEIKKQGKNNFIFLKICKESIRSALYQQQMFSRFFPQQQHSESE